MVTHARYALKTNLCASGSRQKRGDQYTSLWCSVHGNPGLTLCRSKENQMESLAGQQIHNKGNRKTLIAAHKKDTERVNDVNNTQYNYVLDTQKPIRARQMASNFKLSWTEILHHRTQSAIIMRVSWDLGPSFLLRSST